MQRTHFQIAPIFCRPWALNGMSSRLLESHYEHNYGAALARLNALTDELAAIDLRQTSPGAIARLKRDQVEALRSTLLHELYFASLGGDGRAVAVPESMAAALVRDFGSVNQWRDEFMALGSALAGGAGWVLLTWLPRPGRLINEIGDGQSLPGAIPILALDMYEHAYHLEYGANADAYVACFMRNIDWAAVAARYEDATKAPAPRPLVQKEFVEVPAITPEELQSMIDAGTPVQIIDTRPRHSRSKSHEIMAHATWRDPERVDDWIGELSKTEPVVTFCVYGFHVGCQTAATLRKAGFDARYMAGGHFAWKAIRGPVEMLR